ncbi:14634_t:CDS:1, partial [Funneliformis mosseae]
NIFKYIYSPLNLALSCKAWSNIANDPYTKTEWLLQQFGRAHAFFHGIRLGPTFINKNVCQSLFAKKAIFSRYLVQKLLMHYGKFDLSLIDLKIKNNVNQSGAGLELKKYINPWAGNLPLEVFLYLLKEGKAQFGEQCHEKGNDMELFHFLSAGPH